MHIIKSMDASKFMHEIGLDNIVKDLIFKIKKLADCNWKMEERYGREGL